MFFPYFFKEAPRSPFQKGPPVPRRPLSPRSAPGKLAVVQRGIRAPRRQQRPMGSCSMMFPWSITRIRSASTMVDLRAGIHAGGGLVQDEHRRVPKGPPGDGEQLPLPHGEVLRLPPSTVSYPLLGMVRTKKSTRAVQEDLPPGGLLAVNVLMMVVEPGVGPCRRLSCRFPGSWPPCPPCPGGSGRRKVEMSLHQRPVGGV